MFFFKRRKPGMFLKRNTQDMATYMPNRGQRRGGGSLPPENYYFLYFFNEV